jgi:LacI family transcriptional regulator
MREKPGKPESGSGVTLRDVARLAGVHPGTASRALDPSKQWLVQPSTSARVQAVARDLGYRPHAVARSLRSGQTRTVGVVVADIANPFIAVVIRAIANGLDGQGYLPFIVETNDESERLGPVVDTLVGRRVDAIITTAARLGDLEVLRSFADRSIPIVLAVRTIPGAGLPSVGSDDLGGGRMVAEHLIRLGHRHVMELRGPDDVQTFRDRHEGFTASLRRSGVKPVDRDAWANSPTLAEGRRLMAALLDEVEPLPTALFAHNDAMAVGAQEAMEERGLTCPGDISIVGYNDAPLSEHMTPPLTTVRYPSIDVGRFAAEVALQHITDRDRPGAHLTFPAKLIERSSSAPFPPREKQTS